MPVVDGTFLPSTQARETLHFPLRIPDLDVLHIEPHFHPFADQAAGNRVGVPVHVYQAAAIDRRPQSLATLPPSLRQTPQLGQFLIQTLATGGVATTIFYFCSEHCRQKFLAEHINDVHHDHGQAPQQPNKYFCPMCEGVESEKPGDCPKCGMALQPVHPATPKRKTSYTCPMHPEIEQDGPGTCPKCGMELEPKLIEGGTEEDALAPSALPRQCPSWSGLAEAEEG